MREYSTPLTVEIQMSGSLTDDIVSNGLERPQTLSFSRKTPEGWTDVTAAEFLDEVRAVAKGLLACGIGDNDRVGLVSKTRYEWTLLDYALWYVGAVTVPIYESSSAQQIEWILSDSGAIAVVAETNEHTSRVRTARGRLSELKHIWCLDDKAVDVLGALGTGVSDEELERRRSSVTPLSLATLIYTSGTTGEPKGCMLTHGNLMFELGVAVEQLHDLFDSKHASTLLFLPLGHVFARIIQVGAVKAGVRLAHSSDVMNLVDDLQSFQPTFILAVPRVFERLFNTASQNAAAAGRGRIFDAAADTAIAYSLAVDKGKVRTALKVKHMLFDKLVFGKLRAALGGECEYAISGGAPLGERLGHFYRGIGLVVLEGYGLTETTGAVTVNLPSATKIGTVGRPLEGTLIRVEDDGELVVNGGQVMAGYWEDDAATRDVLDRDGWLHTGDLGEIDDEGFLRITGRRKEILVTAGGKNVAPNVLEDRVRAHHLVSQCMVVGDGQPFIAALVTIDPETFPRWAEQNGKTGTIAELVDDPDLRAAVATAIEDANQTVSQAESIRKFEILPVDWTEESGLLTPSLKLKRSVVMRQHRPDVEALYENGASSLPGGQK